MPTFATHPGQSLSRPAKSLVAPATCSPAGACTASTLSPDQHSALVHWPPQPDESTALGALVMQYAETVLREQATSHCVALTDWVVHGAVAGFAQQQIPSLGKLLLEMIAAEMPGSQAFCRAVIHQLEDQVKALFDGQQPHWCGDNESAALACGSEWTQSGALGSACTNACPDPGLQALAQPHGPAVFQETSAEAVLVGIWDAMDAQPPP